MLNHASLDEQDSGHLIFTELASNQILTCVNIYEK